MAQLAGRLLVGAVVYERERGSSWEDMAQYLDMDAPAVEERFAPELGRWNAAFVVPYCLDETGRRRIPQLPTAAYDPESACRRLDLWAHLRLTVEDKHAVSAGLRADIPTDDAADPTLHDIGGWIWQRNLAAFLELLSQYVGCDFDETDWDAVALGLEATDDEDPDDWYAAGRSYAARLRIRTKLCRSERSVEIGPSAAPCCGRVARTELVSGTVILSPLHTMPSWRGHRVR